MSRRLAGSVTKDPAELMSQLDRLQKSLRPRGLKTLPQYKLGDGRKKSHNQVLFRNVPDDKKALAHWWLSELFRRHPAARDNRYKRAAMIACAAKMAIYSDRWPEMLAHQRRVKRRRRRLLTLLGFKRKVGLPREEYLRQRAQREYERREMEKIANVQ